MTAKATAIVRRTGRSLVVTIPKAIVDRQHLRAGEEIIMTIKRNQDPFAQLAALTRNIGPVGRAFYRGRDRA